MKIAFVVNNYPPRTGGVELHVRALALELVALGHDVLVVTLGPDTGWREDAGVSVLTLPERFRVADILGFPHLGTRRRLARLLKEREVEIVSVHTRFFPMCFIGWRAAKAAGAVTVHTEHGSDHVSHPSALVRTASKLVDYSLGRAVLRGSSAVLGVSEDVTAFVRRLAGVEARVFYNAIPASVAEVTAADVADTTAVSVSRDRLLFVGRLVAGKGWEDFLSVLSKLKSHDKKFSADVYGDGSDLSKLRQRVTELQLAQEVEIHGRVSQQRVRAGLRNAILVNPTCLAEGFQTTILEALAEGGEVVTYPVPGAAVLAEAGAPVRITSARELEELYANVVEALESPLPAVDGDFISSWTWPERAKEYVAICVDALERRPNG